MELKIPAKVPVTIEQLEEALDNKTALVNLTEAIRHAVTVEAVEAHVRHKLLRETFRGNLSGYGCERHA